MKLEQYPEAIRIADRYALQMTIIKDIKRDVILYANKTCADALGTDVENLIGSHSSEHYPEHEAFNRDDWEIYTASMPKLGYLESFVDDDGEQHQLITNKVPLDIDGTPCVLVSAIDLTHVMKMASQTHNYGRAHDVSALEKSQYEHRELMAAIYDE